MPAGHGGWPRRRHARRLPSAHPRGDRTTAGHRYPSGGTAPGVDPTHRGPSPAGISVLRYPRMEPRRVRIGIDTGETFTDVVAVDEATGRTTTTKTPSTPSDPAEGFLTGVRKVLDRLGLDGSAVTAVSHGTTVGI